jgi:hypothetical protein
MIDVMKLEFADRDDALDSDGGAGARPDLAIGAPGGVDDHDPESRAQADRPDRTVPEGLE